MKGDLIIDFSHKDISQWLESEIHNILLQLSVKADIQATSAIYLWAANWDPLQLHNVIQAPHMVVAHKLY